MPEEEQNDSRDRRNDSESKRKAAKSTKKHRSVLQIKLGKLAVQIGYGGTQNRFA